jgi:phospholipase C
VIYQENWSFDGLYGKFPGADGLDQAAATVGQVDKFGKPLAVLPSPSSDPNIPSGLPVRPYDLAKYVSPASTTKDLIHAFYTEQLQIDNGNLEPSSGAMDKFVTWSSNGSLVQGYYDATRLPVGLLAQQYTLCDHYFHAAFGGSFLNHQFLVAAAAPPWLGPLPRSSKHFVSHYNAASKKLVDANLSMDTRYAVNTTYAAQAPHPGTPADQLLPPINNVDPRRPGYRPTIGNRLDDARVSWKWYSGGWDDALAGRPGILFAYHHQPLAYYEKYAPLRPDGTRNPATTGPAAHLQDERRFFVDLATGQLPTVSFIKPYGRNNEHPGYASVLQGQQHVADIVHAIENSAAWGHTAIIITYDENGGRWDHVAPPKRDAFGPGSRVPAIVISPYTYHGGVCHTSYDTLSILKTIEERYALEPLDERDAGVASMVDCFQAQAAPVPATAYLQPDADDPSRSALIVGGTPGSDRIRIGVREGTIAVGIQSNHEQAPREWKFDAAKISRIEVYGKGGNDDIAVDDAVTQPALLSAGDGNDRIRAGGGPSIVVAGGGDDQVEGGKGRNIVIGGRGNNRLKAGSPDDLLINGWTDFDADAGTLRTILAEWVRPNLTYAERMGHLSGKVAGGKNGPAALNDGTIHRDH